MAIGLAQLGVLIRAMEVDVALLSVDDLPRGISAGVMSGLEASQPKNPRSNEVILGRRPVGPDFSRRLAGLKNHTRRSAGPDLLGHLMQARWGLLRILDTAAACSRGADGIRIAPRTMKMPEFLLVNRHQKAIFRHGYTQRLKAFGELFFQNQG